MLLPRIKSHYSANQMWFTRSAVLVAAPTTLERLREQPGKEPLNMLVLMPKNPMRNHLRSCSYFRHVFNMLLLSNDLFDEICVSEEEEVSPRNFYIQSIQNEVKILDTFKLESTSLQRSVKVPVNL